MVRNARFNRPCLPSGPIVYGSTWIEDARAAFAEHALGYYEVITTLLYHLCLIHVYGRLPRRLSQRSGRVSRSTSLTKSHYILCDNPSLLHQQLIHYRMTTLILTTRTTRGWKHHLSTSTSKTTPSRSRCSCARQRARCRLSGACWKRSRTS